MGLSVNVNGVGFEDTDNDFRVIAFEVKINDIQIELPKIQLPLDKYGKRIGVAIEDLNEYFYEEYLVDDLKFIIYSGRIVKIDYEVFYNRDRNILGVIIRRYNEVDDDGNYIVGNSRYISTYSIDMESGEKVRLPNLYEGFVFEDKYDVEMDRAKDMKLDLDYILDNYEDGEDIVEIIESPARGLIEVMGDEDIVKMLWKIENGEEIWIEVPFEWVEDE